MTTHDALLAAVIAAPDDDLPRLVFADHLEERDWPGGGDALSAALILCAKSQVESEVAVV